MARYRIEEEILIGIADQARRLSGASELMAPSQIKETLQGVSVSDDFNFASCTVEQIKEIIATGQAQRYWKIGDSKYIHLSDNTIIVVQIIGFDHDVDKDGKTIPVTLGMKYYGNIASEMSGYWDTCTIRNSIIPSFLATFPTEWQEIIIPAKKYTYCGTVLTETIDPLFLFAERDIFATVMYSLGEGEGEQYPGLVSWDTRPQGQNYGWTRSSYNGNSTQFVFLNSADKWRSYDKAANQFYLAFGFGIGVSEMNGNE